MLITVSDSIKDYIYLTCPMEFHILTKIMWWWIRKWQHLRCIVLVVFHTDHRITRWYPTNNQTTGCFPSTICPLTRVRFVKDKRGDISKGSHQIMVKATFLTNFMINKYVSRLQSTILRKLRSYQKAQMLTIRTCSPQELRQATRIYCSDLEGTLPLIIRLITRFLSIILLRNK